MSGIIFVLKVFITFPVFFWFHLRLFFKYRSIAKSSQNFDEEGNYFWVQRYSRYLLWLYGYTVGSVNLKCWSFKSNFLILNNIDPVYPLFLIKLNDFDKNPPLLFLFTETFLHSLPKTLFKFYSLVNLLILKSKENGPIDTIIDQGIEKIQIPRSICVFFQTLKNKSYSKLIDIAKGGFAEVLLVKIVNQHNTLSVEIDQLFASRNVIKLNDKFLITRINNSI